MNENIRILYIDDNPMDRALVRDSLEIEHGGFILTEAESQEEFEKLINEKEFDVVLSDFNILGYEGLQVLDYIKANHPHIPVILVTGTGSETVAVESMKRGAADYVIKSTKHIKRLPQTILSVIDAKLVHIERDNALKALKESEAKLRSYVDNAPDGIFIADENGKYVDVNPAACKITGYSKEELLNLSIPDLLNPEYLEKGLKNFQELVKTGSTKSDVGFVTKSGENRYWEVAGRKLSNTRFLGFTKDITERKDTEKKLMESEVKYKTIVEGSIQGLVIAQSDPLRLSFASEPMENITGYKPEELINFGAEQLRDLIYPNDRQRFFSNFQKRLQGEAITHRAEYRLIHKNGDLRWIELFSSFISYNGEPATQTVFVNITDRKKAEEELVTQKAYLERLFESSPEAVVILGNDDRIQKINPEFTNIFGYTNDEAIGKKINDLIVPQEFKVEGKKTTNDVAEGRTIKLETIRQHKSGKKIHVSILGSPIIQDNKQLAVYGIYRDITQRKQAEEKLKASQIKLKNIVENSTNLFYMHTTDHIITYMSPQVHAYLGYEAEEAMKRWTEFATDNPMNEEGFKLTEKAIKTGQPQPTYELELQRKDGSRIFVEVREAPVVENGKVIAIVGSLTDITVRKQEKMALYEAKRMIEEIINSVPVRIFWKDKNLKYLGCNTFFARDAGFENPADIIGKDDFQMGWKDQAELYRADDKAVIKNGSKKMLYEEEQTTPSGETVTLLTSKTPLYNQEGEIKGVLGTYLDITERKQAERQLTESKESLLDAQRIGRIGNWFLDLKTGKVKMSDEMYKLIGISDEDASKGVEDHEKYYTPESWNNFQNAVRSLIEKGENYEIEMEFADKKAQYRFALARGEAVYDNKEIVAVKGTLQDITVRKESERIIQKNLREKETLLRELYHRTKNNMQVIISLLSMEMRLHKNNKIIMIVNEISNKIKSMALVHQKLYQSNDLSEISLNSYISDLVKNIFSSLANEGKEIKLSYKFVEDILIDIDKAIPLGLMINEIISNSIKYAFPDKKKGTIKISLKKSKDDLVKLVIQDNGVGFPSNFVIENRGNMGLKIISLLTKQIKGEVKINGENGCEIVIVFKNSKLNRLKNV